MFAVIDLGSNSFHLLIAEYTSDHFNVVDRHSERIQLADKLLQTGRVQEVAIERGIECLQRFQSTLSNYPIEQLSVVATQALRQAENSADFVQRARDIGLDVEIISGQREAELIYRGICDPLPDANFNRLVIDIGGASTEFALGCDQELLVAESIPIGCVSWRDQYFSNPLNYAQQAPTAKREATLALAAITEKLSQHNWQEVYASSGSAKMLTNISVANHDGDGGITLDCIREIETMIEPCRNSSDLKIKGLKRERLDLLAPGLAIMYSIMTSFGIERIEHSRTALREGLLREISHRRVDYQLDN